MYIVNGSYEIGSGRTVNEDYVSVTEFDNDNVLTIIADGAGSQPSGLQPAVIAASEVIMHMRRQYARGVEYFHAHASEALTDAFLIANRVIGAFKTANEEYYSGVSCSMTACLLMKDGEFTMTHIGNTRLYMFRQNPKTQEVVMRQITVDETLAKTNMGTNGMQKEEYYLSEDRLVLTNALGVVPEPAVHTSKSKIRENELILLTTDGVHYAVREEAIKEIVLTAGTPEAAVKGLLVAAGYTNYNDNYGAAVIYRAADTKDTK